MARFGYSRSRLTLLVILGTLPFLAVLIWSLTSSLDVSRHTADRVESIARFAKYLGIALTAVFTGWSVLTDTVDRSKRESGEIVLTRPGKVFVISLYLSVFLTTASAVLQDKADDRVRYWERREGSEGVKASFDEEMNKLSPILHEQQNILAQQKQTLADQSKSLAEQKTNISKANKNIESSGKLMSTMVIRAARELEFTNHRFKDFHLELIIDDGRLFDLEKPENYTHLGKELKKSRDDRCNVTDLKRPPPKDEDCTVAQNSFNRWEASTTLRRYLDPTGQLGLEISAQFGGFELQGSTSHCLMPDDQFSDSEECFTFDIVPTEGERTELSYESTALMVSPNLHLAWAIVLHFAKEDDFDQAFSETGMPGRDATFLALTVDGCDSDRSASLEFARSRANQLRSKVKFILQIDAIDEPTSKTITNRYELREYYRGLISTARCVSTAYTNAPESLVPRIQ